MEEKLLQEILLRLERIDFQIKRFASDAESEKQVRRDRNKGIDEKIEEHNKRIRVIEDYINARKGERQVLKIIIGLLVAVITALIINLFSK